MVWQVWLLCLGTGEMRCKIKGERSWDDLGLLVGLLVCVARQDYKACGRVFMTGSASDSGSLTEKCKVRAR